jgi:hypothetical protein
MIRIVASGVGVGVGVGAMMQQIGSSVRRIRRTDGAVPIARTGL